MNAATFPITQESYNQLLQELEHLKKVERPTIIQAIAEARAQGDLKENAEYHSAKEKQGEIEAKIAMLQDKIARCEIISVDTTNAEHIVFGATVSVKNLDTQQVMEYTLVSPEGVDIMTGKISSSSPIGKSLIGKKRGDVVEVMIPKGLMRMEVMDYR